MTKTKREAVGLRVAVHRRVSSPFVAGLLEGFSGPALMALDCQLPSPDISRGSPRPIRWVSGQLKLSYPEIGKSFWTVMAAMNRATECVLEESGVQRESVEEMRLDKDGKYRKIKRKTLALRAQNVGASE